MSSGVPTTRSARACAGRRSGVVETGERLGGEHLVRRPDRPASGLEVEDAVDDREQRVDVVSDEEHRRPGASPAGVEEPRDEFVVMRGRGRAAARRRAAGSGSATRGWATRSRCCSPPESRPNGASAKASAPTRGSVALSMRARSVVHRAADAPAMPVVAERDEVAASEREVAVEDALLRHVADLRAALARRPPGDHDAAGGRLEQPEQDTEQGGLACTVRAENGEKLAGGGGRSDSSLQSSRGAERVASGRRVRRRRVSG